MTANLCLSCMRAHEGFPNCRDCAHHKRCPYPTRFLSPGTALKQRYMVGEILNGGQFDSTYIGWDRNLRIPVAIREYCPVCWVDRSGDSPQVVLYNRSYEEQFVRTGKRFLDTARIFTRLGAAGKLPHIARVYDVFAANSTAYAVMEYTGGTELRRYISEQDGRLTLQQTRKLLTPVMEDLEELHNNCVLHRDLRPENIAVLPDGTGKLVGFGSFYEGWYDKVHSNAFERRHQCFAPPEYYQGALGPWSDVYAMSAIVYLCLTGMVPPSAEWRQSGDRESDWAWVLIDPPLREVLQKGLAMNPKERIQTMAELRQAQSIQLPKD